MRIYGKTFKEIYALLHWTHKIILYVGAAFITFVIVYLFSLLIGSAVEQAQDKKADVIIIGGIQSLSGFTDPSLVTLQDRALMAFSGLVTTPAGVDAAIYLARGEKDCTKFSAQAITALSGKDEDLLAPDGETPLAKGRWRVETPTLVYDPSDTKAPWKIFAYRYFWAQNIGRSVSFARLFNGIVMSSSTDPASGNWSRAEWVMSASADVPPFPYNNLSKVKINTLSPDLSDIYFYARPSVVIVNGVYFMSLSAFIKGKDTPDRIVLLASPDQGENWNYVGTPLRIADFAAEKKYSILQGGTLLQNNGKVFLAAVLGDEKVAGQGTFIFSFESLTRGKLASNAQGQPQIQKHIPLSSVAFSPLGGGFSSFSPACRGGIITSEYSDLRKDFHIFETFEFLPQ